MKSSTIKRHIRSVELARDRISQANRASVTRIHGVPVVGDLPEVLFALVGSWRYVGLLEDALRQSIFEERRRRP